jgi:hypothetical protein
LPTGTVLHVPGDDESHLYFVAEGLVSRALVTRSGAAVEFALTGNDGVIGLSSVLGGESSPTRVVVVGGGCA